MNNAVKHFMRIDFNELEKFMYQMEDELKTMTGEEYIDTRMNLEVLKAIFELRGGTLKNDWQLLCLLLHFVTVPNDALKTPFFRYF